ncbi:nidogen-like domain-containing protein [Chamaesiphon sp. VAR_48_metabat_135_sub]|uniref:nidogen-like domain-containing protein n=1 Tax=Chamaesiphon sp. VAR_48_metabat_135_sub TaxID=2964699 RepID=UPI00286C7DB5|nr:nidogen-like domain-containing protein [Chamaesiphon sp. VAR_48_metabat_135_sub]
MSVKHPVVRISVAVLSAATLSLAMTGIASAAAIRSGFNGNTLAANDDGSTGLVSLGFTANFFGTSYSNTYVNNNGNLTFTGALNQYTPTGITGGSSPIIAAFFADVHTGVAGSSPVTYGTGTVGGYNAFAANYVNVGYFGSSTSKNNSFQVVLIDRGDTGAGNFDIEYNYDQVQWETGTFSGGDANGLGGTSARAGYSNGAGTFYEFAGSGVNGAFLDGGPAGTSLIANSLNSNGVLGRYTFNARNGAVVVPPADASVPEPSDMLGTAVAGFAVIGLKRKLSSGKKAKIKISG